MGKPRDILDMADPYDAHAYFICSFACDDCHVDLFPDPGFEGCDDVCCCHISDKAKALGWYVPSPEPPDGRMDVQTCYCPDCGHKRGLR